MEVQALSSATILKSAMNRFEKRPGRATSASRDSKGRFSLEAVKASLSQFFVAMRVYHHSLLKLLTGLLKAALIALYPTAIQAIKSEKTIARIKISGPMVIL
jgi:hypothetical protein